MGAADSTAWIAAGDAQRRVALLLLPLRLWLGVTWLRAGVTKLLQPEWFDGAAVRALLEGQSADGGVALEVYNDVVGGLLSGFATPLGLVIVFGEIAIGVALLTGTLTNLALLGGIVLSTNLVLAGVVSPSQFVIVAHIVLVAGGAGAAYSLDTWLSRYLRSPLFTGHRGIVGGVRAARSGLVLLAVACLGAAAALFPSVRSVLPRDGVDDVAFVLAGVLVVTALLLLLLTSRSLRSSGATAPQHQHHHTGPVPAPARTRPVPAPNGAPNGTGPLPDLGGVPPRRPVNGTGPLPDPGGVPPRRPVNGTGPLPDLTGTGPLPDPTGTGQFAPVGAPPPQRGAGTAPPPPPSHAQRPPGPRPRHPGDAPDAWSPPAREPAANSRAALRDQPTTQFRRPDRSGRGRGRSDDPYAELRDLPPAPADQRHR